MLARSTSGGVHFANIEPSTVTLYDAGPPIIELCHLPLPWAVWFFPYSGLFFFDSCFFCLEHEDDNVELIDMGPQPAVIPNVTYEGRHARYDYVSVDSSLADWNRRRLRRIELAVRRKYAGVFETQTSARSPNGTFRADIVVGEDEQSTIVSTSDRRRIATFYPPQPRLRPEEAKAISFLSDNHTIVTAGARVGRYIAAFADTAAGFSAGYTCKDVHSTLLVLQSHVTSETVFESEQLKRHMNVIKLDVRPEDAILVSGWSRSPIGLLQCSATRAKSTVLLGITGFPEGGDEGDIGGGTKASDGEFSEDEHHDAISSSFEGVHPLDILLEYIPSRGVRR
ncbi:uncharacterized protein PHACADRAFT_191168 [Phanerochaete carnosa HHB-10118-sp]|uniref:Uncharacterized protein n=1 Tax=Phanerochaete carnosa (strain HHB-10118-sp) TaxID=650164 RepID=K5V7W9_PHACS|nr:uncharacterized protein PHACADRAFT_191168 [Phanerochaete carnosa HHB-10118-sp]EKM58846.1 hypothetical protein PHACADRAFT_191168 [Phanerochaete carnosa HHB-10118-sp]